MGNSQSSQPLYWKEINTQGVSIVVTGEILFAAELLPVLRWRFPPAETWSLLQCWWMPLFSIRLLSVYPYLIPPDSGWWTVKRHLSSGTCMAGHWLVSVLEDIALEPSCFILCCLVWTHGPALSLGFPHHQPWPPWMPACWILSDLLLVYSLLSGGTFLVAPWGQCSNNSFHCPCSSELFTFFQSVSFSVFSR